MARRGRGAPLSRPDVAPDGGDAALNGADQPGARTIGAMAVARWAARRPGEPAEGVDEGAAAPTRGPYDEADLDPEQTEADKVDFGAVRIPVPRGGQVSVEPEEGRLQAVHVMLSTGRLSVSALAAPRTDRLWPDLAAEIDESLREGGATVRSFTGEWGRELHARTGAASSVFVGVDGPRWMLYGVATGPTGSAKELDAALRRMLRGTVVVRGRLPYPVRTVLPLTVPTHLAEPIPTGAGHLPGERGPASSPAAVPGRPLASRPGVGALAPPSAPRNGVATGRPAPGGLPAAPRRTASPPAAGEIPTEPHGIPRVAAGADPGARPWVNGSPAVARDVPGAGRPAGGPAPGGRLHTPVGGSPAQNGAAVGPAPVRDPESAGQTGQRRVADLLADAERESRLAQEARAPRSDGPAASRPGAPRTGASRPPAEPAMPPRLPAEPAPLYRPARPASTRPEPSDAGLFSAARPEPSDALLLPSSAQAPALPAAQAPVLPPRYDDDVALLRLGGPPGARDRATPAARVVPDGADDWTVPMSVVPPAPASPPEPARDLWAGDPWAVEARRAARAAEPRPADPRPADPRPRANGAHTDSRIDPRTGASPLPRRDERPERAPHQRPAHQRPAHHRPAHERPGAEGFDPGGFDPGGFDPGGFDPGGFGPGGSGAGGSGAEGSGSWASGSGAYGALGTYGGERSYAEPAVDVPAARVPPPVLPAWAHLADERTDPFDEPPSGRHRRPDR